MKRIFIHKATDSAIFYYRASAPAYHCKDQLLEKDIEVVCEKFWQSDDEYDAFIFHGILNPTFVSIAKHLAVNGKKVIMSFDDDVWNLPTWNPASPLVTKKELDIVQETLNFAHLVLVSTEGLKSVIPCDKSKVRVCPNLMDLDLYPKYKKIENYPVRVLWSGSIHHSQDLKVIEKACTKLLEEDNVKVIFFGDLPAKLTTWKPIWGTHLSTKAAVDTYGDKLHYVHSCELSNYIGTLQAINADIALAPLVNCKFNESKSNIKWMEYSLTNSAVFVSMHASAFCNPYEACPARTYDPEYWYEGIKKLVDNPETRSDVVTESRKRIENSFSWQSKAKNSWLDMFMECV